MIDFTELQKEVDKLDINNTPAIEFRRVFGLLANAIKEFISNENRSQADMSNMEGLFNDYIPKIPTDPRLRRIKADAKDIAFALSLATVAACLQRMERRNDALAKLTKKLDEQNTAIVADAELLKKIKKAIDTASATATQIKTFIEQLNAPDASAKSILKALVDALDGISKIFKPDTA